MHSTENFDGNSRKVFAKYFYDQKLKWEFLTTKLIQRVLKRLATINFSGLYYKNFMIVIYDRNVIGQYYKTTIVAKASPS